MTLSKKKSRRIVVNNDTYRWGISPDDGYIVFVAELCEVQGRKIQVYINSDIDKIWVNFPNVEDLNLKITKPKDVEYMISEALKKGWNPKEKGNPIIFDLINDALIKR